MALSGILPAVREGVDAATLLGGGAVAGVMAVLLGGWLARRVPDGIAPGVRVGAAVSVAVGVILVFRPFEAERPYWRYAGNVEDGMPAQVARDATEWGTRASRVVWMHAIDDPRRTKQVWRSRIEADTREATRWDEAVYRFRVTQPRNALIDESTGKVRKGIDGVEGRVLARVGGTWRICERFVLEPTRTSWLDVKATVPPGSDRVALEWLARGSMTCDSVAVSLVPPVTRFGPAPLVVVERAGELFLISILVFFATFVMGVLGSLIARWSVPPRMPEPVQVAPRFRTVWLAALAAAVLVLPLAFFVAPWLEVATTPLIIEMAAPEDLRLAVRFGEGPEDQVPLVRLDDRRWAADLPPRQSYALELVFEEEGAVASLGTTHLVDTPRLRIFAKFEPTQWRPAPGGVSNLSEAAQGGFGFTAAKGTRLVLQEPVGLQRYSDVLRLLIAWVALAMPAVLLVLGIGLILRAPPREPAAAPGPRGSLRPILVTGVCLGLFYVIWAISTQTIVAGDSSGYLWKAAAIASTGAYETHGQAGELTRLPGYPALLAATIKLFGPNLQAIPLVQGLLFAFALTFLASSLRRHVSSVALILAMLVAGVSPVQLYYLRNVLAESPYVSGSLLALGCFFHALSGPPRARLGWTLALGALTVFTTFQRPVGICLLVLLGLTWLPDAWRILRSSMTIGVRAMALARISIAPLMAVALVAIVLAGWTARNAIKRDYRGIGAMKELSVLQGQLCSGMMDPRVLLETGHYDDYVRERVATHGRWNVWYVYGDFFQIEETAQPRRRDLIAAVEERYGRMAADSQQALPWPARSIKYLRSAWWNLRAADVRDHIAQIKLARYDWWAPDLHERHGEGLEDYLAQRTGAAFTVPRAARGPVADALLAAGIPYARLHFPLLVLGLLASLWILWRGRPAFAAPFVFVAANYAMLNLLCQFDPRYMDVLDVFLVFQVFIALGLSVRRPGIPARTATAPASATAASREPALA